MYPAILATSLIAEATTAGMTTNTESESKIMGMSYVDTVPNIIATTHKNVTLCANTAMESTSRATSSKRTTISTHKYVHSC